MNAIKHNVPLGTALVLCLVGFPQISETIYTPALPAVAKGLAAGPHAVEATLAIYFIGFAAGVLLWGGLSDWIGRRKAMLMGIVLYLISCLFCGASQSVGALLFWRFTQALGASVGSVITQTMLRDLYDGKKRAQIFALISGALAFSPAIGPLMGGYISEWSGWRANFWVLTLMGAALFLWSWLTLPETKPAHIKRPSSTELANLLRRMASSRILWGHALLIGGTNGILFSFYEEAPFVFIDQMGMRPSFYGFLGLVIASATIFSARISYRMSGKIEPQSLIKAGAALSVLGGAALVLLQGLGLFRLDFVGITLVLAMFFLLFVGVGLIIPNSLSIALKDYQDMVGTAGSLFGAAYYVVVALSTWGMSLVHTGTAWPLPLYLFFLAGVLVAAAKMVRKPRLSPAYD